MTPFLKEFCSGLIERHGVQGLKDVTIVIPSQRISLFLRKYFSELISDEFWLPEILPINIFVERISNKEIIDDLDLVFELYQSYCEVFDNPDPFDEFLNWSGGIISDFNDIDKYMLNARDVFKNLRSIKEIESWSFNGEELSETQQKFMLFWDKLGELYESLNRRLEAHNKSTTSKVYRDIAENTIVYLSKVDGFNYFIGFSALSTSEEMIFKYLINSGLAEIVWDDDEYYVNNKIMEAGRFIRRHQSIGKTGIHISKDNFVKAKSIRLYPANSNLGQVEVASSILSQNSLVLGDQTALVLADEKLLKPLLNVIPVTIDKINVSMGYPLNDSDCFTFFEYVLSLQLNLKKYSSEQQIYHKDLTALFQNKFIQMICEDRRVSFDGIKQRIAKQNYTFITHNLLHLEWEGKLDDLAFLWKRTNDVNSFLNQLLGLFDLIYGLLDEGDEIERESVFTIVKLLKEILSLEEKYSLIKDIQTVTKLSRQELKSIKLNFLGEPLEGLQLMGLLETRGLDFKNVILLSCNEDVLPKSSFSNSLIPFDLRSYFGLPTGDDKDAIFAYYFYRLLQRAENIHLVYNGGAPDRLSSNELSRYVTQLIHELPQVQLQVEQVALDYKDFVVYKKNEDIREHPVFKERLLNWFEKGVSASAINSFIECPRNFLFTQLLKLKQEEEVEETIEFSTYGTIVHAVLEELYRKAGSMITSKSIEDMIKDCEVELNVQFSKIFPGRNYLNGKNLLLYESALHSLRIFLNNEKDFVAKNGVIEIVGLEQKYEVNINVETSIGVVPVKIKGLIDRIDRVGGVTRIVDYKTGKVEALKTNLDFHKLDRYVLQLLVYLFIYEGKPGDQIQSGIISMKHLKDGFKQLSIDDISTFDWDWLDSEFRESFTLYLSDVINRMISSGYEHNPSNQYCVLC